MGRRWAGLPIFLTLFSVASSAEQAGVTNIVLAGAYGNLAGKYLWKALFSLYLEVDRDETKNSLKIYAAGRDATEKGWPKVEKFLDSKLICGPEHEKFDCKPADVAKFRLAMGGIEYVQLKRDDDYAALCNKMSAGNVRENGRMFYLSVPPFAYAGMAKSIHEKCTPPSGAFLRVAFEKPFGSDLASAEVLAAELAQHLKEEQIYRVDHYLGKRGVQQIIDYRVRVPEIDQLLDSEHVGSVKVIMTESESCEGRTGFYDEYGVVRDVHQNHLTEVLSLLGMDAKDISGDPARALASKAEFLGNIVGAKLEHSVLGQYEGYEKHVQEDRKDPNYRTKTPTFAAASLRVQGGRWANVPVLIVAGKMLDKREAYVEVQFKNLHNPPGVADHHRHDSSDPQARLTFHIQGGTPKRGPEIRVGHLIVGHFLAQQNGGFEQKHNKLFDTHPGDGWSIVNPKEAHKEVADSAVYVFSQGPASKPDLPYDRLMSAMYHGHQDLFVGTEGLMQAWRLWDTLLAEVANEKEAPYVYSAGSTYRDVIAHAAASDHRIHDEM